MCFFFFCTGCSKKEDNKLTMVTEAGFPPYEFYQDGEIVGVDVEIAKEIAVALGKELEVKDVAFTHLVYRVGNNNVSRLFGR